MSSTPNSLLSSSSDGRTRGDKAQSWTSQGALRRNGFQEKLQVHSDGQPLPRRDTGGIVGPMPPRRSADQMPDLFSASPSARASDPPSVLKAAFAADQQASEPRQLLPKDLAGSLKRLDNAEIDTLLAAVTTEAERRGRLPKPQSQGEVTPAGRRTAVEAVAGGLTTGKLNAVRAAFKAGVKPSAIARQFGISQSDVRKALAQGLDRGT